ncbi:MAG: manganese-dependent inorganic pyrophosphatase [Patescibacteria group bacterium]|nr:manganese-dependent inorganic pyrophosphatase [Patescibacteria group bacterium]
MEENKTIYITGHKQPDTDSICASVAYSNYLKQKGRNTVAVRTGDINPETKYVLDYFEVNAPELLTDVIGKKIILLDHNEKIQSPDNIDKAKVIEVIDHHKIDFKSTNPIYFHNEPIGSTSTIIAKKYFNDKEVNLDKKTAGLLLSGVLSDTVIFKSPTSTDEDKEIAEKLAGIAGIKNIQDFGIKMKKSKASLKGLTTEQIISSDFKIYEFGKIKIGGGQVEVTELDEVNEKKQELLEKLKELAQKENYDLIMLLATNIIKQDSLLLFWEKENYIEKAFNKKPENNTLYLEGVMSRKKQIIPPLAKLFSGN